MTSQKTMSENIQQGHVTYMYFINHVIKSHDPTLVRVKIAFFDTNIDLVVNIFECCNFFWFDYDIKQL